MSKRQHKAFHHCSLSSTKWRCSLVVQQSLLWLCLFGNAEKRDVRFETHTICRKKWWFQNEIHKARMESESTDYTFHQMFVRRKWIHSHLCSSYIIPWIIQNRNSIKEILNKNLLFKKSSQLLDLQNICDPSLQNNLFPKEIIIAKDCFLEKNFVV